MTLHVLLVLSFDSLCSCDGFHPSMFNNETNWPRLAFAAVAPTPALE